MDPSTAELLRAAATTLDNLIALARSKGLTHTAQTLTAAKLSLLMDAHDISDTELREFCATLEASATDRKAAQSPPAESGDSTLAQLLNLDAAKLRRSRMK